MKKKHLVLLGALCVALIAAIGTAPRYIEELVIGGGYDDPVDGGTWLEKDGDVLASGSMTADGDVAAGGNLTAGGAIAVAGDAALGQADGLDHRAAIMAGTGKDAFLDLHEGAATSGGAVWYDGSADRLCIGTRDGTSTVINAIEIARGSDTVEIENLAIASSFTRDGNYQGLSTEGLIALWHCENTTSLTDWSGNSQTATIGGTGVTKTTGKFGTGLSFTGTGYAEAPNNIPNNYGAADLTIAAWIKTSNSGSTMAVCGWYGGSSGECCALQLTSSSHPRFSLQDTGGANTVNVDGPEPVADGKWHLLVGVRDYANTISLYVDGAQVGEEDDDVDDASDDVSFYIASASTTFLRYSGTIDEVCLWDRPLSASEVHALYNQNRDL